MNKTLFVATLALALAGFTGNAQAGHDEHRRYRESDVYDYARVLEARPIVRQVRIQVPVQECWQETVYREHHSHAGTVGPAIAGGLIGGAIGHQFGSGSGRRAMTVVGALVGSAIAHDVAHAQGAGSTHARTAYPVERCETRYDLRTEERVEGYHVTYRYKGRVYATRTVDHPGKRIRVRVDVRPAAYQ